MSSAPIPRLPESYDVCRIGPSPPEQMDKVLHKVEHVWTFNTGYSCISMK